MPLLEPLWVFTTYGCVLFLHTFHRSLPIIRKNFRFTKHLTLICHISIPIVEIISYHFRALYVQPYPTTWDLVLCLAHSFTALRLALRLSLGDKVVTRPNYQAIASLRAFLSILVFVRNDEFYYRASIRVINGFVYLRICIKVLSVLKVLPTYSAIYTTANFVASLISLYETQLFLAPYIFVVLVILNICLNRWVAVTVRQWAGIGLLLLIALSLYKAGFVEKQLLKLVAVPADRYLPLCLTE